MRKMLFLLALLMSVANLTGATKAASTLGHVKLSDPELERAIRAKLVKSKIGKDGLTFKVKGGVVTWEGATDVMQHKGAATRMARTAGAVEVVNNIKISDAARLKAAGNLTGEVRRAQVKTN